MRYFKSKSQAAQDVFVASMFGDHGTYIEVGAAAPASKSNTYNLELSANYKGFGIEYNKEYKSQWDDSSRKNIVYWEDALTFDYVSVLKENNLSTHLTYLSCDIEPARNTFQALKNIVESGITFDCITFEHDFENPYSTEKENYDIISREFLENNGYRLAVYDVKNFNYIFESWYVKNTIDFIPISWNEWTNTTLAEWNNKRAEAKFKKL